ncbi:hypothetical protein UPYG_G00066930 [Umbra pygmaea]|uniref:Anaphase-promoting complex subunit 11 n=1 Tax=Umbra pygmaea TaxID=75934 RepID=A0ABD0XVD7_UMBPY
MNWCALLVCSSGVALSPRPVGGGICTDVVATRNSNLTKKKTEGNVWELLGNVFCLLQLKIQAGTGKMKVKIKEWNGVASWLWVANDDNCGICRMPFNGCCPECKVPGDDCPLVWGQCSHCFHMHCILKWLNSQQVQQQCPMCRQEWKFKE